MFAPNEEQKKAVERFFRAPTDAEQALFQEYTERGAKWGLGLGLFTGIGLAMIGVGRKMKPWKTSLVASIGGLLGIYVGYFSVMPSFANKLVEMQKAQEAAGMASPSGLPSEQPQQQPQHQDRPPLDQDNKK